VTLYEVFKITPVQYEETGWFRGAGAGKARLIVDQRELAKVTARSQCREQFFALVEGAANRYRTNEDNEQRFSGLPFRENRLARKILFFKKFYQKLAKLPSAQTRKERNRAEKPEA
jgi:hypothetical protein